MSETSAFLRRSCRANFDSKNPVSSTTKSKVRQFERLIRGQDKYLSTKEYALERKFLPYLLLK